MSDTAIAPSLTAHRRRLHRTSLVVAVVVWGCALAFGVGVGYATDSHDVAAAEASDEVGSHPAMTTTSTTAEPLRPPAASLTPDAPHGDEVPPPVPPVEAPRGDASPHPVNGVTPSDTPTTTEANASPGASPVASPEPVPTTTTTTPTTSIPEPPQCPPGGVVVGGICYPVEPQP